MKTLAIVPAMALLAIASSGLAEVSEMRQISKVYERADFGTDSVFLVRNVWGPVHVERSHDGRLHVEIAERRVAADAQWLERSREILPLRIEQGADFLGFEVGIDEDDYRHRNDRRECRECRLELEFRVKIPADLSIDVSSVMDGAVTVEGDFHRVSASNVNAPVFVNGISACEHVRSVNGDVTVSFSESPRIDCELETVNGAINISLPDAADANLSLSSRFGGEAYSDFDLDPLAAEVEIEEIELQSKPNATRWRIRSADRYSLGHGGAHLSLSTLNGDMNINRQEKSK